MEVKVVPWRWFSLFPEGFVVLMQWIIVENTVIRASVDSVN